MEKEKISTIFKKEFENDEVAMFRVINTPFNVVYKKKNKVNTIVVGNNIISLKEFSTKEKAYNYIMEKPWELITNFIWLSVEKFNQLNQTKND